MNRTEQAPESQDSRNAEAHAVACCSTSELSSCCEPAAKGGCCGPQAESPEKAPVSCGCR